MTFAALVVRIEQNEEFQESSGVHYTCWDKITVKLGEGGFLDARGGVPEPLEPSPGYAPVSISSFNSVCKALRVSCDH